MKRKAPLALALLFIVAGLWATDQRPEAQFYYDLGPAEIDVTAYPDAQKQNYETFRRACSQCHTTARPLNAPISAASDWKRYVRRMHIRTKSKPQATLSPADAQRIVDFLVFDSKLRKIERKAEFQKNTERLERLFAQFQQDKSRRDIQEDRNKARPAAPYTGNKQ
ncbi:MAG: hypothetical protein HY549_06915 [Elusimicrobia bacterium]|nr:hypothetical protein [Elusimicrobiota bacterium]